MANDTLETVAGKINAFCEKMDKAGKDMRAYRASRNVLIVEAHERVVVAKETELTWAAWVEANLTLTRTSVDKILLIEHKKSGLPEVQNDPVECEESEEEALAETRKEIAEQAKAPVHHEANQARRIVEAMGFDNLRVFDTWYMPHRTALIGPTDEVLALRADLAAVRLEWHNFQLASETQSPLPTPKPRKQRDMSDPSPDEEATTKLWRSYLDMPSKSVWMMQRFNDIKAGVSLELKGQGDASFQVVRDYEVASKEVRALFDTKLRTQQSDKKHKGDDF